MPRRPDKVQQMAVSPAANASGWPVAWICTVIFLVTFLAYLPALKGGFIWDDDGHITRLDLRSFSGLYRIWFEIGATQQYYPLLHSAFWLEHRAWGDSPLGYHLINILFHASAACLFGGLLRRLAIPGAWFAALLYALHPVCVESVAWISEQKNTLSAVFYLGAALAYLRFDTGRRNSHYAVASGFFLLALLTKTVTASLPAALWVIFWWQRGHLSWRRDILPLLPWLMLGAASGLFTAHFERELIGASGADFTLGVLERCLLAGRIFWFYLGKLAWPADLIFIYPHWTVDASVLWQWIFPLAGIALLAGLIGWRKRSRTPLAIILLFGGTLFPVLGFINVFPFLYSYVADHFQYLASLPIFAVTGAGGWHLSNRWPAWPRFVIGAGLLALLGELTWTQCEMYRDLPTLYQTTLNRNPGCWMAYNNLAVTFVETGRPTEGIPLFEQALKFRPDYAEAENNLGDALNRLGSAEGAIPHLEKAVQLQPHYFQAHDNLGIAFMTVGKLPESLAEFELTLKQRPDYADAERNLGLALAKSGRTGEALPHFERAVKLNPRSSDAELSWAIALMLTSGLPAAIPHFERAIELEPNSTNSRETYARALTQAGRVEEGVAQLKSALQINPDNADLHLSLALGLRQLGRKQEAADEYLEAIRLKPSLSDGP